MIHDATMIVLILLVVSLTVGQVLSLSRIGGLRESNSFLHEAQAEMADRAVQAERNEAVARTELAFLQKSIMQIVGRNTVAVMTDDQVQFISNAIAQLVQAQLKPNSLN